MNNFVMTLVTATIFPAFTRYQALFEVLSEQRLLYSFQDGTVTACNSQFRKVGLRGRFPHGLHMLGRAA